MYRLIGLVADKRLQNDINCQFWARFIVLRNNLRKLWKKYISLLTLLSQDGNKASARVS